MAASRCGRNRSCFAVLKITTRSTRSPRTFSFRSASRSSPTTKLSWHRPPRRHRNLRWRRCSTHILRSSTNSMICGSSTGWRNCGACWTTARRASFWQNKWKRSAKRRSGARRDTKGESFPLSRTDSRMRATTSSMVVAAATNTTRRCDRHARTGLKGGWPRISRNRWNRGRRSSTRRYARILWRRYCAFGERARWPSLCRRAARFCRSTPTRSRNPLERPVKPWTSLSNSAENTSTASCV
mmetsp:Transcript_17333/g.46244  ORF Transcript_17333/g.46244 Transcript_17333/m.46244 type:complete len:241 (-) Transcript_17333:506-1228(-)